MKRALSLLLAVVLLFSLGTAAALAAGEDVVFRGETDPGEVEFATLCAAAIADAVYPALFRGNEGGEWNRAVFDFSSFKLMDELVGELGNPDSSESRIDYYSIGFFDKILPCTFDEFIDVRIVENSQEWTITFEPDHENRIIAMNGTTEGRRIPQYTAGFSLAPDTGEFVAALNEIAANAMAASDTPRGMLEYLNQYIIDYTEYGYPDKYIVGYENGMPLYDANGGQSVKELLEYGIAVCGGYTHLVSYLCLICGIPNVELSGTDHSWNLVFVDGEWKMLDVTWDDTTGQPMKYFLVDDIDDDNHDWENYENPETLRVAKMLALALSKRLGELRSFEDQVFVTVSGEGVGWPDARPFIDSNDRTLVPLRPVAYALGLQVSWDGENREAVFTDGRKTMRFPIDSNVAKTSDGTVQMTTAAIIREDRTYAPIRYLAEYFGFEVEWQGESHTVAIYR